jgi:hypothetical protein
MGPKRVYSAKRSFDSMRAVVLVVGLVAGWAAAGFGQTPAPAAPPNRVIGIVTAVASQPAGLTIKTDAGETYTVVFDEKTRFQRVAPGEKDLSKAEAIQAADVAVGDRILARGPIALETKTVTATLLIDMSQADLAKKQERERAEWQKRGMLGTVTAVDPAAKEIRIQVRSAQGPKPVVVHVGESTVLRRYAPDSVRFSDAKTSPLAEVTTGDQLRVKGNKSADGDSIDAEEVVSGSFKTSAGTITSVNADASQFQMKDLETGKVVTVKATGDSTLRRLPSMPMGPSATTGQGGPGSPSSLPQPPGGGRPGTPTGAGATAGGPGGGYGGGGYGGGGGRGMPDLAQMMERLPATTLGDLKAGESVLVSSTRGAKTDSITAITLLANADFLIARLQAQARPQGAQGGTMSLGSWNLDMPAMPMQ